MGPRVVALLVGLALLSLALPGCDQLFPKPLVPDFLGSPTSGKAPLEVQFEDRSQSDPKRPIIAWEWAFGDGESSAAPNPAHTYAAPGVYTVSLTIFDSAGRRAALTKPDYIVVTAADEPPPPAPKLPPEKGNPQAKVTMVEFSDYLCPYCAKFATLTLPEIEENYVEAGKVRLVFRHLPVHGEPSTEAALAALCAHEQGRFWEYHDRLFVISLNEGGKALTAARLRALAGEMGLESERFDRCLASREYAQAVQADLAEAKRLGVEGTPTFFINGRKVVGAQPYEAFRQVIEEELAK
ncbi:MAG: thioredoxin domain-containing protein [Candidatus Acetothermia bacterium]|jgi:protein-disulfide isomerase|nr:thioredoxin domain-containing protein [Candidatus Acetothermia bacterium]MDH7505224.1 thioredoxin domain-containing protein [Candidatus Acetothermia bacterium]